MACYVACAKITTRVGHVHYEIFLIIIIMSAFRLYFAEQLEVETSIKTEAERKKGLEDTPETGP